MLVTRHQNSQQNHKSERANRYFKNVAQFKYLGSVFMREFLPGIPLEMCVFPKPHKNQSKMGKRKKVM
jgi:hypothetical protein